MNTTLDELREQLAALSARVAALESSSEAAESTDSAPVSPQPSAAPVTDARIDEETVLVISAAIAAFLGKRPRIRQIRLITSPTWAQQGRIGIHASHALPVQSRSGAFS